MSSIFEECVGTGIKRIDEIMSAQPQRYSARAVYPAERPQPEACHECPRWVSFGACRPEICYGGEAKRQHEAIKAES